MKIRRLNPEFAFKRFAQAFPGCAPPHKDSLAWYCIHREFVVGWATARHVDDLLIFNGAEVMPEYRGNGWHRRLIRARLCYARHHGLTSITYTAHDNWKSINNLVRAGFLSYIPEYRWAGKDFIYWQKLKN